MFFFVKKINTRDMENIQFFHDSCLHLHKGNEMIFVYIYIKEILVSLWLQEYKDGQLAWNGLKEFIRIVMKIRENQKFQFDFIYMKICQSCVRYAYLNSKRKCYDLIGTIFRISSFWKSCNSSWKKLKMFDFYM